MEENIKALLNEIRPYLNSDGGDISFEKFEDGIVYVHLSGACSGCQYKYETINTLILDMLQENLEGIKEIRLV